ncbi:type II toxin-antitoxin system VapC family toxin [Candidatus Symbiobacter mobilis]|uniref:PilT domain protein n=1 Tax=Candidatus Symbiobacter mobilis CR TaxID=946483 RepID=U5N4E8_9BURK|nr:type II toxin-antitoxin system VapC family toxin [Candidatus Symbiobacter mobilis]AGX86207.1 PilT domain protein [Candidatus Symbiobacter mobilis CR]
MLLDSNIIIYAAEPGYERLLRYIDERQSVVSIISKIEVIGYHKLSVENSRRLVELFAVMSILPLSDAIASRAISLRQLRKMSLGDSLIAATALEHELPLVTANAKDFSWVENIIVINPLE